jgi:predicted nucleic acid-binding Zn ribbon protein
VIGPDETEDPWRGEPGESPQPVAEAVERLAAAKGWGRRLDGARVHAAWREIAGERLAQHTEPVRLHGGVLVVRASSSAWAAQIPYLANEIMARANAVLGEGQVSKVVVARGAHPP